jgi:signal transduction histidine kinase
MAVPRYPGQTVTRTMNHSNDLYLTTRLIRPVSCLLVIWGVIAALVLSGTLGRWRWLESVTTPGQRAVIGSAVLAGTGMIIVFVAALLMNGYARRVRHDTEAAAATAERIADERIAAAGAAEASLRNGFQQILDSLGKRNQSLLHRQLRIIDALEQQASSPAALAELFTLDHLTTRMRRHAESLSVLSGAASGRSWGGPVPVIDVMRAAAAEVEDYTRVTVLGDCEEAVAAAAVTDMIHLLAELIENATLFSPSSTRVELRADRVANGLAVEVEDRGLGIPPEQLRELNAQLAAVPDFSLADADRLGLFVAGRLAGRHGVHVSLSPSAYLGTKAVVVLPDSIVIPAMEVQKIYPERSRGDSARLNLHAPEVLSLAGVAQPGRGEADGDGRAVDEAAKPAATTFGGLPRRVRSDRQSSGDGGDGDGTGTGTGQAVRAEGPAGRHAPVEAPAPEDARNLAASLQSSWHRSRDGHRAGPADDDNEEA